MTPVIVLVEPQLPENIGMVARAMANFGLDSLRLVNPREQFPCEKVRSVASKADHVVDQALVFDNLYDAVADLGYVLATTARARDMFKPVISAVEAGQLLRLHQHSGRKSGILFGRERSGLSNDEIGLADQIVTFPVNPVFSSLNIAQAVLLISYEWRRSGLEEEVQTAFSGPVMLPASRKNLYGLICQLEKALDRSGYFHPLERKSVMVGNLRSVLTRAKFSDSEISLLRGAIKSLERPFLKDSSGRGREVT